jgi:predicted RNA methylase
MNDRRRLDKFYTKEEIALNICNDFKDIIEKYDFIIEPSAGNGSFIKALRNMGYDGKIIGIDIEPEYKNLIKSDFLKLNIKSDKNILVIGNPPFGKNSNLAVKFLKKAKEIAKEIIFILPDTFHKESIKKKLNGLKLINSIKLPNKSFYICDVEYDVPTSVFHFRVDDSYKYKTKKYETDLIQFVSKDEADYAIRRVGALAGKVLKDFKQYSESSNYFVKSDKNVMLFLEKNFKILNEIAKKTAGNPSLSKNELKKFLVESREYLKI